MAGRPYNFRDIDKARERARVIVEYVDDPERGLSTYEDIIDSDDIAESILTEAEYEELSWEQIQLKIAHALAVAESRKWIVSSVCMFSLQTVYRATDKGGAMLREEAAKAAGGAS